MKLAFVGPSEGDTDALHRMVERLLMHFEVDKVVYLGLDDTLDRVMGAWAESVFPGGNDERQLVDAAARLACAGSPGDIDAFLAADRLLERLRAVRRLPSETARAVEMVDDRIVTVVYDKAMLNEEDIANSSVLVYGKAAEPFVKRFGPRCFFTPGPLSHGRFGLVELDAEDQVFLGLFDTHGQPEWREAVQGQRGTRMKVM
ncbi:MAG: hypothetical protein R3A78_11360 [Polyangiales bacterium]|nr:hypothetical protein [Myxococcales bacterium]